MVASVRGSINTTDSSGFLMTISPHVRVSIIPLPAGFPNLLDFRHRCSTRLDEGFGQVTINLGDYAPTAELRRASGATQSFAVGALTAQDGRFVIFPVAFAEVEPSVLGPEEEPDRCEDKRGTEQGKEREDAPVVDVSGVKGPRTRFGLTDGRGGIAGCEERVWELVALEE